MKKEGNLQLELFSRSQDSGSSKNYSTRNPLLTRIWNYEKIILIMIGIVITSIISYSLGVEKGRRLSILINNFQVDIPSTTKQPKERVATEEPARKESSPQENRGFIIQLASYKSKSFAQKEAESLKKKGFSPLILSKGSYSVICLGNFSNKDTAKSLLSELKKRYRDCYIRRL